MQIIIPATIIEGYVFQEDPVTELIKVTKDRLNLLGSPSASFTLPNGSIIEPDISISDETADGINVSIKLKDFLGNDFLGQVSTNCWLTNPSNGESLPAGTITSKTVLKGVVIKEMEANQDLHVVFDSNGELSITFITASAVSAYLNLEINNILFHSSIMTWIV